MSAASPTIPNETSQFLPGAGAATGAVRLTLRIEGGLMLVGAVVAYRLLGGDWLAFALLFLVPDLSMLGYFGGPRFGALTYNAAHALIGPALLGLAGLAMGEASFYPISAIWIAHIGFDRVLGYGLKYPTSFGATHLGWLGKRINGATSP